MENFETQIKNIKRNIPFSPPDISELEIAEVAEALRSSWITTDPRTKELERRLAEYTGDDLIAKEALRSVVPTFKRPEEVNKEIA